MAGFGEAATSQMMALMAEEVATMIAGFEEAAVSSMRASTVVEVAAVMAGLVGAAAAIADSRQCCDCGGGGSMKRSR